MPESLSSLICQYGECQAKWSRLVIIFTFLNENFLTKERIGGDHFIIKTR